MHDGLATTRRKEEKESKGIYVAKPTLILPPTAVPNQVQVMSDTPSKEPTYKQKAKRKEGTRFEHNSLLEGWGFFVALTTLKVSSMIENLGETRSQAAKEHKVKGRAIGIAMK
jgi:hypothetical protein